MLNRIDLQQNSFIIQNILKKNNYTFLPKKKKKYLINNFDNFWEKRVYISI